jgi:serine/threonine-protein kinase RsbW
MLANPNVTALRAASKPDFPGEVQHTLDKAWAEHPEVPTNIRIDVATAAAEVGSNILNHSGRDRDLQIRLDVLVPGDHVRVEFTDDGPPAEVDLESARMPDVMAENGRGLALARACLAELSYRRDDSGNRWTLVSQQFR